RSLHHALNSCCLAMYWFIRHATVALSMPMLSARVLLMPEKEIRFELSGNICRCTGYDKIVRSVQEAAKQLKSEA
ncbi:MAG: 2Fe-2S iron-sulfur cluster-binding protein, partial [Planctomycetota bacterium]